MKEPSTKKKTVKKPAAPRASKKAPAISKVQVEVVETANKQTSSVAAAVVVAKTTNVTNNNAYYFAIGRRKRAVAQVRLFKNGKGNITVNGKDLKVFFPLAEWQQTALSPLQIAGQLDKLDVTAKIIGGGVRGQAEALRHGIARALLLLNPVFRRSLKKVGFLTRDPREKERKKYGLKRARRAPQWAKR